MSARLPSTFRRPALLRTIFQGILHSQDSTPRRSQKVLGLTVLSVVSALTLCAPALASAQTITATLALFSALLNALIGILITIAIVIFFWGLIKYMMTMGTEDAHKAIHLMIWGIVAIFVMVSIWGIIQLLQRTFGVENNRAIIPATVPFQFR